ncbi:MAG: LysR substrate-binding domain-containing protein [Rhodospirillales bacterium]
MSITLLKTLIAISERGSFSAAADEICISQAAVGQQMKRLEENLNVTLFGRSQRTLTLNQLGKALVPKARGIVHAYETMLDDLVGGAAHFGQLTLGAVPSTTSIMVPMAIKRLVAAHPNLHVHVVTGLSDDLTDQVERGALDVAILSLKDKPSVNMNWQPLAEEEMVLLASPQLSGDDPLQLLREQPYIRHTRRGAVGVLAEAWLSENNIPVRGTMELESLDTVVNMVSHNLGVSLVPNICVPGAAFAAMRAIPLGGKSISRKLSILTRADCPKFLLVDQLLKELLGTIPVKSV